VIAECVCCGAVGDFGQDWLVTSVYYCSVRCAEHQLRAVGTLLHSTPRPALSVQEWHDLSADYASELELLNQVAVVESGRA